MAEFRSTLRSYGVDFAIISNDAELLSMAIEVAKSALLGQVEPSNKVASTHNMMLKKIKDGIHFSVNGEDYGVTPWPKLIHFFDTCVRLLIAEYAVNLVFLHCGVIVWKDRTILFPGDSFAGKTTLVAEFVKRGAVYYSDEYAILDRDGYVHPFARPLALRHRTDLSLRFDTPVQELGGIAGTAPARVDFIFLLTFKNYARFDPKLLSAGEAVLNIMPQAISLRINPEFTLLVLNKIIERAKVFSGQRGNSIIAVSKIIKLIDKM